MSDPASGDFDVRLSWPADGLSDRPAVDRDEQAPPASHPVAEVIADADSDADTDDVGVVTGVVPLPVVARRLETIHRDLARLSDRVDALARALETALAPSSDAPPPNDTPTTDELLQPVREEIALLRRRISLRVRPPTTVLGDDQLAAIADAVVQRLAVAQVPAEQLDAPERGEEPPTPGE